MISHRILKLWFFSLSLLVCFLSFDISHAQELTVQGKVIAADDDQPVPGVTVLVKNTDIGTITNLEGIYTINVPSFSDTLLFSFVGMEPVEIAVDGRQEIDVVMEQELYEMQEVVVTALGIKRESKALGYSATSVEGDDLMKGEDRSMLNSLQGKVAGVNITSASGAPGSSTRIIMRGFSSLGGSNQPLFIVDGMPVNNSQTGSTSINGGTDFGNKVNDLNPDDIESVTVLKGAAGTALYGSRAANGVIVITTRKGESTEEGRSQITFSSGYTMERPLRLVKYQNDFGQGINGNAVAYENMSWGPRFDSKMRPWGNIVDNAVRVKPYRALPSNVEEFFDTGRSFNNALSISGGNSGTTYYLSYSNVLADGIFPTDADKYNRHTVALRSSTRFSERLNSSTSINYVKKQNSYVPTGQGEQSVYNQIMQTPRDISLREISNINSKWNTIDNYYSLYTINPYFILHKNGNENNEDRVYGNLELDYAIAEPFSAKLRVGADVSNEQTKQWSAKIDPHGNNEFSALRDPGNNVESSRYRMEINSDFILNYTKSFGDISVDALVGHNINQRSYKGISVASNDQLIEDFPHLSNTTQSQTGSEYSQIRRLTGIYTSVNMSFKNYLFLTATARNDWSSTLPEQNNSFFYPGVNAGFVFTDLFPGLKSFMPYGKIRAGWARVGNDAPPYSIYSTFTTGYHSDGFGYLSYPLTGGINAYELGNQIGNENLQPELSTEFELGTDLRFFANRLGIDFTWYDRTITDLIWAAPIAYTSGYGSQLINLGEITNRGVEALLNIVALRTKNVEWEFSLNFTKNNNKLVRLNDELDKVVITGIGQIQFVGKAGRPVGIFEGRTVTRDDQGRIIVDNTGIPKPSEDLVEYGTSEYDYMTGGSTRLRLGNFSVSATVDVRQGGIMYSRTKEISHWSGTVPRTTYNMREPFIVPNSVYEIDQDDNGDPVYTENTIPVDRAHILDYWANGGTEIDGISFIDKSFIKLREVVAMYRLPVSWLKKMPIESIQLSAVGKNLLLWTPAGQYYIDPEMTTFGNDLAADFGEFSATPAVRSITFNLRMNF